MHTNQLRQIMTICQEGSINRAAKVLNCSQPNLSHSLRELEKELGFTVFRRTSAGVRLTPQGETLLSHVSDILYHLDIVEQISDEGRGAPTSFHAALPSSSYCGLALSRWIPTAFQETDAAEVHLCETGTEETIERVFSGSSDLGIIRYPLPQEAYYQSRLAQKELVGTVLLEFKNRLLIDRTHPLADREQLRPEELQEYTEILLGERDGMAHAAVHPLARIYEKPMKRLVVCDLATQLDLLGRFPGSYAWSAPLPRLLLETAQLVSPVCDPSGEVHRDMLIWKKFPRNVPLTADCIRFLQDFVQMQLGS